MRQQLHNQLQLGGRASLDRLAWGGPRGWESYKDKQCIRHGKLVILKDYYVKSKGCK